MTTLLKPFYLNNCFLTYFRAFGIGFEHPAICTRKAIMTNSDAIKVAEYESLRQPKEPKQTYCNTKKDMD